MRRPVLPLLLVLLLAACAGAPPRPQLAHEALQRVLYDIEAGLPLLFIDQLIVQTSSVPQESGRLRVQIAVAGPWSRGK